MMERLQKVLARAGLGSRRHCETIIAEGRVKVNDRVVDQPGTRVDPEQDEVTVDGSEITLERHLYFLLNKPKGVVCTNRPRKEETSAVSLVPAPKGERLFCVGRLDQDSHGAIIVTNDGAFANLATHPRYGIAKSYRVMVRGRADGERLEKIRHGIHLSEGRTSPAKVHVVKRGRDFSVLRVTLREGRNRHIRRIFARVGLIVTDILRLQIGDVMLGRLKTGDIRALSREEVMHLEKEARAQKQQQRRRRT